MVIIGEKSREAVIRNAPKYRFEPSNIVRVQGTSSGLIKLPIDGSANPLLLHHFAIADLASGHPDKTVQLDVYFSRASGQDPAIKVVNPNMPEHSLCTFYFDEKNALPYYLPRFSKPDAPREQTRMYILPAISGDRAPAINGHKIYRGSIELREGLVATVVNGEILELSDFSKHNILRYSSVYDSAGKVVGSITSDKKAAAFASGATGIVGPFEAQTHIEEGTPTFYTFPNRFETVFYLMGADMPSRGIDPAKCKIWCKIEEGKPIEVYLTEKDGFPQIKDPVYFRVLRDENWRIVDTARSAKRGLDLGGIKIMEGVETYLTVDKNKPNSSSRELIAIQKKTYAISTYPAGTFGLEKQFKSKHASVVIIDNNTCLFKIPEPAFNGTTRRIAELAIKTYNERTALEPEKKLAIIEAIKISAQEAYSAYKANQNISDNQIEKYFRGRGLPQRRIFHAPHPQETPLLAFEIPADCTHYTLDQSNIFRFVMPDGSLRYIKHPELEAKNGVAKDIFAKYVDSQNGDSSIEIYVPGKRQRLACTLFIDKEENLVYYNKGDGTRVYLVQIPEDESTTLVATVAGVRIHRRSSSTKDLILAEVVGGNMINLLSQTTYNPLEQYYIYGEDGMITDRIVTEKATSAFLIGKNGYIGPFLVKGRKGATNDPASYYSFPTLHEEPGYHLHASDLKGIDIETARVWCLVENGHPIKVFFGNETDMPDTSDPIYFKVVRDKDFNVIGSFRRFKRGFDFSGITVVEGLKTSFCHYPSKNEPNKSPFEAVTVADKYFRLGVLDRKMIEDRSLYSSTPASIVIVDNEHILFYAPGYSLDHTSRELAQTAIAQYKALIATGMDKKTAARTVFKGPQAIDRHQIQKESMSTCAPKEPKVSREPSPPKAPTPEQLAKAQERALQKALIQERIENSRRLKAEAAEQKRQDALVKAEEKRAREAAANKAIEEYRARHRRPENSEVARVEKFKMSGDLKDQMTALETRLEVARRNFDALGSKGIPTAEYIDHANIIFASLEIPSDMQFRMSADPRPGALLSEASSLKAKAAKLLLAKGINFETEGLHPELAKKVRLFAQVSATFNIMETRE